MRAASGRARRESTALLRPLQDAGAGGLPTALVSAVAPSPASGSNGSCTVARCPPLPAKTWGEGADRRGLRRDPLSSLPREPRLPRELQLSSQLSLKMLELLAGAGLGSVVGGTDTTLADTHSVRPHWAQACTRSNPRRGGTTVTVRRPGRVRRMRA